MKESIVDDLSNRNIQNTSVKIIFMAFAEKHLCVGCWDAGIFFHTIHRIKQISKNMIKKEIIIIIYSIEPPRQTYTTRKCCTNEEKNAAMI